MIHQRRKNKWISYLLLLIPVWSCNQAGYSEVVKSTSVDTVISPELTALRAYFQKTGEEKVDSTQKIPLGLMSRFIKGANFDTTNYVSEVNPIDVLVNRYGSFFIVKVICSDGGACANFYLLAFDKKGYNRSTQLVGRETGEESFINMVEYRIPSDTVLLTYVVKHVDTENGGEKVDTIERHVFRLSIPFHG